MKIRVVTAIFAVVLSVWAMEARVQASEWVGENDSPKVVTRTPIAVQTTRFCSGVRQTVEVIGDGTVAGCLYGTMFQYPDNGGGSKLAASLTPDGKFYRVRGLCTVNPGCMYAPETDIVIGRQFSSGYSLELYLVRHFSRQLDWKVDPVTLQGYFEFNGNVERPIVLSDGRSASIGNYTLSRNGEWAVVELIDKGIARLNTRDGTVKRIMAPGYRYGYGRDPRLHLAMSNNGQTGVITGENAGFTMIGIDADCGEPIGGLPGYDFLPGTRACPTGSGGMGYEFPGFEAGLSPMFSRDDRTLTMTVQSRPSGNEAVVFRVGSTNDRPVVQYLALGDSFSSGEGETDRGFYLPWTNTENERCHVSRRAYSFVLGQLKTLTTQNVACSGARTTDIVTEDAYSGGQGSRLRPDDAANMQAQAIESFIPGRVPQARFVADYQPAIVTIGVGGNDSGLMDKLAACAMPGRCEWVSDNRRTAVMAEYQRLYPSLVRMYSALLQTSPRSNIYAVGYPLAVSEIGSCRGLLPLLLDDEERRFMNESILYINEVIKAAAKTAGVHYLDTSLAFDRARLCDDREQLAMNGLRFGRDIGLIKGIPVLNFIASESFHPTPYGHEMIANHLSQANPNLFDQTCSCAEYTPAPAHPDYWAGQQARTTLVSRADLIQGREGRKLELGVAHQSFKLATEIKIEVHSQPQVLTTTRASAEGGFEAAVELPIDLEEGIHTIYVIGEDRTGQIVEYYQSFWHETDRENAVVGVARVQDSAGTAESASHKATRPGTVMAASSDRVLMSAKESLPRSYIPLLLIGMGIMAVWLILVLLLRNLFLRNYFIKLSRQVTFWKRL